MFACPHCEFQLVGKSKTKTEHGTSTTQIKCSHCDAVLRIDILTLKDPDYKKLAEKGRNEAGVPTTFCPNCQSTINLSDKTTHKCSTSEG